MQEFAVDAERHVACVGADLQQAIRAHRSDRRGRGNVVSEIDGPRPHRFGRAALQKRVPALGLASVLYRDGEVRDQVARQLVGECRRSFDDLDFYFRNRGALSAGADLAPVQRDNGFRSLRGGQRPRSAHDVGHEARLHLIETGHGVSQLALGHFHIAEG